MTKNNLTSLNPADSADKKRMQTFLDTALDAIISIDENGLIIEFNASAERTFGYTREEVLNKELSALIIPEKYREGHRRGMQAYMDGRAPQVLNKRLELFAIRRDGTMPLSLPKKVLLN